MKRVWALRATTPCLIATANFPIALTQEQEKGGLHHGNDRAEDAGAEGISPDDMKITAPASVPEEGLANAPPPAPAYSEADSKLPALSRFQPQLALFILGAGVAARGM